MKAIRVEIRLPRTALNRVERALARAQGLPQRYEKSDDILLWSLNRVESGAVKLTFTLHAKEQVELLESLVQSTLPMGMVAEIAQHSVDIKQIIGRV